MFSVCLVWHEEKQGRDFAFSCLPGKGSARPQVTHCLGRALWIGQIHFGHYVMHAMLDGFLCIGKIVSGAYSGSTLFLLQRWVLCI